MFLGIGTIHFAYFNREDSLGLVCGTTFHGWQVQYTGFTPYTYTILI